MLDRVLGFGFFFQTNNVNEIKDLSLFLLWRIIISTKDVYA